MERLLRFDIPVSLIDQGYRDIEPQEPLHSIVQKTTSNSIQAIRDTFENIDHEDLQKAIQILILSYLRFFING